MSKITKFIESLGVDETLTKKPKKEKVFTSVYENVPHLKHHNYMADLLHLPKTTNNNIGLLVVKDLGTGNFDIEPYKTKTAESILKAFQEMTKRKFIKNPKYSIQTDNGGEFKGVFHDYFKNMNVFHKFTVPSRHKQNSTVESFNKTLGRILNGYMNMKEYETGKTFKDWDDILQKVRSEVNDIVGRPEISPFTENYPLLGKREKPVFNVGDIVYVKSEVPLNALGHPQPTDNFRVGDLRYNPTPKKVKEVLPYPKVGYRYIIQYSPNVSYTANELLKAEKEKNAKYIVERFIKVQTIKKKKYYEVKWKGYSMKENTLEAETELIKDIGKQAFDKFVQEMKKK